MDVDCNAHLHLFQSTPPREGRQVVGYRSACVYLVSIHAPARGATIRRVELQLVDLVSIHAPARGATAPSILLSTTAGVSIHAPARGATSTTYFIGFTFNAFQSTPPREGRRQIRVIRALPTMVSIHAPARGATRGGSGGVRVWGFNPRPRERGDRFFILWVARRSSFNPRPRERGDSPDARSLNRTLPVSIHAPARGATDKQVAALKEGLFQSTPPREGRQSTAADSRR